MNFKMLKKTNKMKIKKLITTKKIKNLQEILKKKKQIEIKTNRMTKKII